MIKRKRNRESEETVSITEPQPVKKENKLNKKKRKKVKGCVSIRKTGASDGLSEEEILKKFSDMNLTKKCPPCKHEGSKFNHPCTKCNYKAGGR